MMFVIGDDDDVLYVEFESERASERMCVCLSVSVSVWTKWFWMFDMYVFRWVCECFRGARVLIFFVFLFSIHFPFNLVLNIHI